MSETGKPTAEMTRRAFDIATTARPLQTLPLLQQASDEVYAEFMKRAEERDQYNPEGQAWVLKLVMGGPSHNHKAYGKKLDFHFNRRTTGTITIDIVDIDVDYNGDWTYFAPLLPGPAAPMPFPPISIYNVDTNAPPPPKEFTWRIDNPKKPKRLLVLNANTVAATYKYSLLMGSPIDAPIQVLDPFIENDGDH